MDGEAYITEWYCRMFVLSVRQIVLRTIPPYLVFTDVPEVYDP